MTTASSIMRFAKHALQKWGADFLKETKDAT